MNFQDVVNKAVNDYHSEIKKGNRCSLVISKIIDGCILSVSENGEKPFRFAYYIVKNQVQVITLSRV